MSARVGGSVEEQWSAAGVQGDPPTSPPRSTTLTILYNIAILLRSSKILIVLSKTWASLPTNLKVVNTVNSGDENGPPLFGWHEGELLVLARDINGQLGHRAGTTQEQYLALNGKVDELRSVVLASLNRPTVANESADSSSQILPVGSSRTWREAYKAYRDSPFEKALLTKFVRGTTTAAAAWLPVNLADEVIPLIGMMDDPVLPANLAALGIRVMYTFVRVNHYRKVR